MRARRVFLIVLDSLGIGAAPDAALFGDAGSNTLLSVSKSEHFNIPTLLSLGLSDIDGLDYLGKSSPDCAVARLREISAVKDTTGGHWEMAGIITHAPMPTYPDGFPRELVSAFEELIGTKSLCGLPYSGTAVIAEYGQEHMKSGYPIIYTSSDSVFQIAAHEDIIPPSRLYEICRTARKMLCGRHAVGRVIARPFLGEAGSFYRTDRRRDFSLEPPRENMLSSIKSAGLATIGVGKISDIFAACGISESYPTHGNEEGMDMLDKMLLHDFSGLCFVNLVDFDMLYGHRQDKDGYAKALSSFDSRLSDFIPKLRDDDLFIITADHGCDPSDQSTDHTREYVPLLIIGKNVKPQNLGTLDGFTHIGKTVCTYLGVKPNFESGVDLTAKILNSGGTE